VTIITFYWAAFQMWVNTGNTGFLRNSCFFHTHLHTFRFVLFILIPLYLSRKVLQTQTEVKFTLKQATKAQKGGGVGIKIYLSSFFNLGARWGWVANATPRSLYPWEKPGTHCTEGWVGPRHVLERCGKSRPYQDSISGPSRSQGVAIPTDKHRNIPSTHKLTCFL
jgi:hypothetical protein